MAENNVTSDDKLWAALAYVFTPLIPIVLLVLEDKKDRPYIKQHNMQALVWAVVVFVLYLILTAVTFGLFVCLTPILWIPQLYWAYKAYQGEAVTIPIITDFVKNQGWA